MPADRLARARPSPVMISTTAFAMRMPAWSEIIPMSMVSSWASSEEVSRG
ncbi:hypothetical protein [Streptomyces scopuliridis]